jgi:phage-related protein
MEILFFEQSIEDFIAGLDKQTIAKTLRTLDLLERFENHLGMPHSKRIDSGLFELRVRGVKEVRIIYCFHKNAVVLLYGFIKKSQKIPHRIIGLVKKRLDSLEAA